MKTLLLMLVLTTFSSQAVQVSNKGLMYSRSDGTVLLSQLPNNPDKIRFTIETNVGMHSCSLEGIADVVENSDKITRLAWIDDRKFDDGSCRIDIMWFSKQVVIEQSDACNNYCGLDAGDSMQGRYR